MQNFARSLDLIYEAAFLPELWENVLDDLALSIGAQGTSFGNIVPTGPPRWLASASLMDMQVKMFDEGWATRNTRADKLLTIVHHGFVDEAEHFTEEDYNTQPIFTEVMKPLGYGFGPRPSFRRRPATSLSSPWKRRRLRDRSPRNRLPFLISSGRISPVRR